MRSGADINVIIIPANHASDITGRSGVGVWYGLFSRYLAKRIIETDNDILIAGIPQYHAVLRRVVAGRFKAKLCQVGLQERGQL